MATMDLVKTLETNQCTVEVYDTGWCVDYYHIYCIKSYHKNGKKVLTRFGTEKQVKSILSTYKNVKGETPKGGFTL